MTLIGLPHYLLVNHYQGSCALRSSPSCYGKATALIPPIRGFRFPNGLIWGKLTSIFRNDPLFWDASQFADASTQKQSDGTSAAGQRTKASNAWDSRCTLAMSGQMHKKIRTQMPRLLREPVRFHNNGQTLLCCRLFASVTSRQ